MGGGGGGVESQLLGCSIFKLLLFLFLLGTILQGSLALAIVAHSAGKYPSWIPESSPAQGFILSHTSAPSSPTLPSAPYWISGAFSGFEIEAWACLPQLAGCSLKGVFPSFLLEKIVPVKYRSNSYTPINSTQKLVGRWGGVEGCDGQGGEAGF